MAAIGDAVDFTRCDRPAVRLHRRTDQTEQEYVLGEYLDAAEVYQSFRHRGNLTATPYIPHTLLASLGSGLSTAAWSSPIAVLLLLYSFFLVRRLVVAADLRPQRQEQHRRR